MRKLLSLVAITFCSLMLVACVTGKEFKADTYEAKTLTGTLREYVELPLCTSDIVVACHTKEVAKLAATAADQWTTSNAAYKKAVDADVGVAAAKAANDVSLAALQAVANSDVVQKAIAKK